MAGMHERVAAMLATIQQEQEELAGQLGDREAELVSWKQRAAGEEAGLGEQQETLNKVYLGNERKYAGWRRE
jgi:hypothetical protein